MREIEFRGKSCEKFRRNGEWVYGSLVIAEKHDRGGTEYIIVEYDEFGDSITVAPETVGQYTGLKDKNGEKIFEGDILRFGDEVYYVFWSNDDCGYNKISIDSGTPVQEDFEWFYAGHSCVIGNIYDNSELLEAQE